MWESGREAVKGRLRRNHLSVGAWQVSEQVMRAGTFRKMTAGDRAPRAFCAWRCAQPVPRGVAMDGAEEQSPQDGCCLELQEHSKSKQHPYF